jgi:multiple sugar transport system permease protein
MWSPTTATSGTAYRLRRQGTNAFLNALTLCVIVMLLFPFIWMALTSFKNPVDFLSSPPTILPHRWTLSNYGQVLSQPKIGQYFLNSLIVSTCSTILAVLLGSAAAYSLSRIRFPIRLNAILVTWILLTRMYPAISTALPYFFLIKTLGLYDTQVALVLTYTSFNLPFVVWLMLGFFDSIPREVEAAAVVDGCSFLQRFVKIALPLSGPGLVATTLFSMILAWNEFLFAVILTSFNAETIPVVIAGFITDKSLEWGQMSALGTMFVTPVILIAWGTQRYLIRGLTLGAIKE